MLFTLINLQDRITHYITLHYTHCNCILHYHVHKALLIRELVHKIYPRGRLVGQWWEIGGMALAERFCDNIDTGVVFSDLIAVCHLIPCPRWVIRLWSYITWLSWNFPLSKVSMLYSISCWRCRGTKPSLLERLTDTSFTCSVGIRSKIEDSSSVIVSSSVDFGTWIWLSELGVLIPWHTEIFS